MGGPPSAVGRARGEALQRGDGCHALHHPRPLDRAHSPTLRAQAKEWRLLVFRSAYGPLDDRMAAGETLRRRFLIVFSDSTWSPYDHRVVRQFRGHVVLYRIK